MSEDSGTKRRNASIILLLFAAAIAALLWLFDPVTQERTIGVLMGAELVAFAMITYAYTRPSDSSLSELWMILGTLTLAFLVGLALI
jgi:hypothetical protein